MEVVKEVENVPTTADKPNDDVVIVDCGELAEDGDDVTPAPTDEAPADGGSMEAEKPETD
ncbi:unnamed protein product [Pylaiella littoralis]